MEAFTPSEMDLKKLLGVAPGEFSAGLEWTEEQLSQRQVMVLRRMVVHTRATEGHEKFKKWSEDKAALFGGTDVQKKAFREAQPDVSANIAQFMEAVSNAGRHSAEYNAGNGLIIT